VLLTLRAVQHAYLELALVPLRTWLRIELVHFFLLPLLVPPLLLLLLFEELLLQLEEPLLL